MDWEAALAGLMIVDMVGTVPIEVCGSHAPVPPNKFGGNKPANRRLFVCANTELSLDSRMRKSIFIRGQIGAAASFQLGDEQLIGTKHWPRVVSFAGRANSLSIFGDEFLS